MNGASSSGEKTLWGGAYMCKLKLPCWIKNKIMIIPNVSIGFGSTGFLTETIGMIIANHC